MGGRPWIEREAGRDPDLDAAADALFEQDRLRLGLTKRGYGRRFGIICYSASRDILAHESWQFGDETLVAVAFGYHCGTCMQRRLFAAASRTQSDGRGLGRTKAYAPQSRTVSPAYDVGRDAIEARIRLADPDGEIVVAHLLDHRPLRELARIEGVPFSTYRRRFLRAFETVRKVWVDQETVKSERGASAARPAPLTLLAGFDEPERVA